MIVKKKKKKKSKEAIASVFTKYDDQHPVRNNIMNVIQIYREWILRVAVKVLF